MNTNQNKGIWEWSIVRFSVGITLTLIFIGYFIYGFTEEGIRFAIKWTAKISGFLFSMAFGASAIHLWVQNSFSFWLFRNRKFFGISFAIIHFLHLAVLIGLQFYFHPVFEKAAGISLLAGGFAYLFIILMFLTSFEAFSKFLNRNQWKWLHLIGGYWILGLFLKTNWKGALFRDTSYFPMAILLGSILLLRLWKLWQQKKIKNG